MGRILGVAAAVAVAVLVGVSMPAQSLYAYLPNFLVVSTGEEADSFIEDLAVSFGVQFSEDPYPAERKDLNRVHKLVKVMERHWERLDADCDPDAIFALMYLQTTRNVRMHLEMGFFDDNDYLSIITVLFAQLYLDAYGDWHEGRPDEAPLAWQEAFEWADTGDSDILEDQFLGMNAHINYDLSVAIAALGTVAPDGAYRKPDMDRINDVLADTYDDVAFLTALYYGPSPPTSEPNWGDGHAPETELVMQAIFDWREAAWLNGVAIEEAPNAESRATHDTLMQQNGWTIAQGFQTPKLFPTAPGRVAYCQANP